jgi:hypothetical protein
MAHNAGSFAKEGKGQGDQLQEKPSDVAVTKGFGQESQTRVTRIKEGW